MPRTLLATGTLLLSLIAATALPAAAQPSAADIAGQVMTALGGKEAWDATHYLRFTFAGRRTHHWDKWSGRHRVEGQTPEGQKYVVLHNLNTREGEAWLDGKKAEGEAAKEWLDRAYGAWINDTYWLLMPYKLQDPGVNLTYEGSEQIEGVTYDKLHLTFGNVGLTPGDEYWAYINRDTHLMDRWAYLLQAQPGQPRAAEPTVWRWLGWQKVGNIQLAPMRAQLTGDRKLELTDLAVFDTLPDSVFASPEPVAK
jgi:hypothetical protein